MKSINVDFLKNLVIREGVLEKRWGRGGGIWEVLM